MEKLVKEFPSISLTAIDSSVLYVKNLEDVLMLDEYDENSPQHRFVVFKKVSGSIEAGKDRLITSIVPLEGSVSYGTMSNLLANAVSGKVAPQKLSSLPVVKTRTKKLVQEEKAKRQRKKDQSSRKDEGTGSSTPGGFFHDNDGSRDGRKAERERRRQEHRAQNPDYKEKTPEEIAELERQRRLRMEEMAKEWNMEADDLPPEGEPFDDEDYDDADEGETTQYDVDEDDEDGDDVMDLD